MSWLSRKKTKISRTTVSFFVVIILASTIVGGMKPSDVKAQIGFGAIGAAAGGFPVSDTGLKIWNVIKDAAEFAWEHGAAIAYRNAARTFTQQIAYDLAVYVGSGGQGQQPLFVTKGWGEYLNDVTDTAAGDFLDTLARNNGYLEFGLCSPAGIGGQAKLIIGLSAFDEIKPRQPKCSLSDIQKNWEQAMSDPKRFLAKFGVAFDPRQHDLGIALKVRENIIADEEAKRKVAELELEANRGLKNITAPITGAIKTPAAFLETQFGIGLKSASDEPLQITGDVAADALGVFTNTLASRLMKRLFQQGLVPNPSGTGPSSIFGFGFGGIEYAVQVNNSISTPQLISNNIPIDIISELVNCPTDTRYASINNCTIDRKFEQILRKADEGQALTVKEAIQQGFLNGGWKFKITRPTTVRVPDAWYLSDLKKLRKARIVSVGWELAAERLSSSNVTLQEVVEAFDNCAGAAELCKLIDPNWVLRAPPSQCRLLGPGQILDPQGGSRQDSCVDVEQCVAEGPDGACQAWGYCLAEKNVWQFSGDSCEFPAGSGYSPYASCQTFSTNTGQISLLTNSLANYDDGVCSGAAGCKWYSSEVSNISTNAADRYSTDEADRYYLKNLNQYNCAQSEVGCTSFLRLQSVNGAALVGEPGDNLAEQLVNKVVSTVGDRYTNYASVNTVHLKEAPSYLQCYDTDALGIANTQNDSTQCRNYLQLCSAAEVGCELYSSNDGNPAVPAIVQATDYCPQECVNLNRYYQSPSFFEPTTGVTADFIPSTATMCTAQAIGCEEFTNLDGSATGEQREYYSKLQQCIAADSTLAATYFTWVGSDLTGFQLKDWRLQSQSPGSPDAAPFTTSGDCRDEFGTTNPDCKQFYTVSGFIHYRLASEVVTASTTCSRYRSSGVVDASICNATNGEWDGTACIYHAIPGEGQKCEARYNGCREFKGPNANNVQLLFAASTFGDQEQIEGLSIDATPASGWGSGTNSNESLAAFGHSFSSGSTRNIARIIPAGVKAGNRYLVSYWAKKFPSTGAAEISITAPAGSFTWNISLPAVTDDWQLFKIESTIPAGTDLSKGVFLVLSAADEFVIDNITVKNNFDTFYIIKNSWETPAVCGVGYLGCKAYSDRSNRAVAATGFSQLCRAEAVGCEPLINTQNSDRPQSETVSAGGNTITTPADEVAYRIYDQTKACPASAEACRMVGEPNLSSTGEVTGWGDKIVKLDPDLFDPTSPSSPLCTKAQDRCQEFTQADGSRHSFKDPGNSLCEYKQINALTGYNWYKRGTNELCNLVANASFETMLDRGSNLLLNGNFETSSSAVTSWTQAVGAWAIDSGQYMEGEQSVKVISAGTPRLTQTFRVTVGQVYTARVTTYAAAATTRNLRVFGCGEDMTDTTQVPGLWQNLQITFRPTTTICNIELRSSGVAGDTFYDDASVVLAERFNNWMRNGDTEVVFGALTNLSAKPSIAGNYWGSQVAEVETTSNRYSGIWSDQIDLGAPLANAQTFVVSAHVYVPDIPQNAGMLAWQLSQHAYNVIPPGTGCPIRVLTGIETCHHYDYEPNPDITISEADKGRWVYKQALITADAGVRYMSVGLITNFGDSAGVCTASTCRANQVVYVDQISLTPGIIQPAYQCPANQASCTAFQDPVLTKQTYYYLNNEKLDRNSCAGKVGEKDGCLLFSDLSNGNLSYNATVTYNNSRVANNALVNPASVPVNDTNSILRVNRSRVCGEWLSCQSEALQYDQSGNSKSVCYALGRCDTFGSQGAAKCGNWKTLESPQPLTITQYQARETNWSSQDLSGYSIPNIYPIDTLKQKRYSTNPSAPNIRLTYLDDSSYGWNGLAAEPCGTLYSTRADGAICLPIDLGLRGAGPGADTQEYPNTSGKLCRLYPEASAPFPSNLATFKAGGADVEGGGNIERKNVGFTETNICQPVDSAGNPQACECSYQRVSYEQGEQRYYALFGQPDLSILIDKESNSKSRISRQDYLLGLRGYCLEKDTSRAINGLQDNTCLTWLPLDVVSGDISIYDYAPDAGFNNPSISHYCSAQGAYHQKPATNNLYVGGNFTTYWQVATGNYDWLSIPPRSCGTVGDVDQLVGIGIPYDASLPILYKEDVASIGALLYAQTNNSQSGGYCTDSNNCQFGDNRIPVMNQSNNFCAQLYLGEANDTCDIRSPESTVCSALNNNNNLYPSSWAGVSGLPCGYGDNDAITIKAVFDLNDKLIGYNAYYCSKEGDGGAAVGALIIHAQKDYCKEISQVSSGIENKAWTNRLLNAASGYTVNLGVGQYNISSDLRPFGAVTGSVNIKTTNIPVYQYTNAVRAASPYSCLGSGDFDCGLLSGPNICIGGDKNRTSCSSPSDSDPTGCGTGGICIGTRFAVPNETVVFEGAQKVQTLFAKLFGIYRLSDAHKGYDIVTGSLPDMDISDNGIGRCSLSGNSCTTDANCDTNTCNAGVCSESGDTCVDTVMFCGGANTGGASCSVFGSIAPPCSVGASCAICRPNTCVFSYPQIRQVNNINATPSEGANGFTIIAAGTPYTSAIPTLPSPAEVTAAFYAYNANGEQMPLREVRVDWLGDPDNSSGASGKYKNHKAYCKKPTDAGYNFGDSPQACVDDVGVGVGYFTFTRSLTCTAGGAGMKDCSDPTLLDYQACWDVNGAGAGVGACVFKPRVYVRDNWDWCYGGTTYGSAAGRWGISPAAGAQCDIINTAAWLPFNGNIIVRP